MLHHSKLLKQTDSLFFALINQYQNIGKKVLNPVWSVCHDYSLFVTRNKNVFFFQDHPVFTVTFN